MKKVIKRQDETRQDYLLRVTYNYLEQIEDSEECDVLANCIYYDGARCDGSCLKEDIGLVIEEES